MKKIAFVIYRAWAYEICKEITAFQKELPGFEVSLVVCPVAAEFDTSELEGVVAVKKLEGNNHEGIASVLSEYDIDIVCYYGWSWLVKEPVLSRYTCLCLHPSPLPRYRGGSPIQHQIIHGEEMSAVSIFKMGEGLDDGPLYCQVPFPLIGNLDEVFNQMVEKGIVLTESLIRDAVKDDLRFIPQDELEKHPPYKRRTKAESELLLQNIASMNFRDVYNFVRALTDPYPNAYITLQDCVIYIQEVEYIQQLPREALVLAFDTRPGNQALYMLTKDGYAYITKYRVE